jgi:hypothetical protein
MAQPDGKTAVVAKGLTSDGGGPQPNTPGVPGPPKPPPDPADEIEELLKVCRTYAIPLIAALILISYYLGTLQLFSF